MDPMEEESPSCQEEAYVQHDHLNAWDHGDVPLVAQMEEGFQEMEAACHLALVEGKEAYRPAYVDETQNQEDEEVEEVHQSTLLP